MVIVFSGRKIITMDRNFPIASHVAVRNGVIVGVGGPDCGDGWGKVTHDPRFADKVIMPGLIEAHAHVSAGGVWRFTYCGHYTRSDPNGTDWPGLRNYEALIDRLRAVAQKTPPGEPVVGWGFDPNFLEGRRLDKMHLDQISTLHLVKGADGLPNGELQEFAAMGPAMAVARVSFSELGDADAVAAYGRVARNCGVTTVADLLSELYDDEVTNLRRITGAAAFPARYVPVMNAMVGDPEAEAQRAAALRARSTSKLDLGRAKLFTDGAIQGFTAKLKAPGYFNGPDNGMWNMDLEHYEACVRALHRAGIKTHIHTNGDAASEMAIDVYEKVMLDSPNPDLRHTLEHVQLAGVDQFKRMKALGLTINLFSNHVHYFGDLHLRLTIGPDRAHRMNAARDAWDIWGGDFAIHSDAPVTPMAPLATAWAAVNRVTETGQSMGTSQQITVPQALHNITMGAAYVLKLDHKVGSIQSGKFADFTVLDDDPLEADPLNLKDVPVVATVLGGEVTV